MQRFPTQRLIDPEYLAFPFRVEQDGPATVQRRQHIRELIEQVLLTNPNERVFRLEFGAGVRRLVFEPNGAALWSLAKQRLIASLGEVLRGELDPNSLVVDAQTETEGILRIRIAYRLATINLEEEHLFEFDGSARG